MVAAGAGPAGDAVPCSHPVLSYGDERDEVLVLEELPSTCRTPRPFTTRGLVAGDAVGWYVVEDDGNLTGEIERGETVIRFTTTLTAEEVATTLAGFVPLVLPTAPPTTTTTTTVATASATSTSGAATTTTAATRATSATTVTSGRSSTTRVA